MSEPKCLNSFLKMRIYQPIRQLFVRRLITTGAARMHLFILYMFFCTTSLSAQQALAVFHWPEGKQVAVSLTFDDGRTSQVDRGTALM
jgi:peptidoglycan-N-acetylglucosamine deacetylase